MQLLQAKSLLLVIILKFILKNTSLNYVNFFTLYGLNSLIFDLQADIQMTDNSNNIKKLKTFEVTVIIIFWVLLFGSPLIVGHSGGGIDWKHVLKIWTEHFILFTLFILNRFVLLPFLFFRNKQRLYIISAFLIISIAVGGMFLYNKNPAPRTEIKAPPVVNSGINTRPGKEPGLAPPPPRNVRTRTSDNSRPEPIPAYVNLLIMSVLVFGFDTGLKMTSKWVLSEQQRINIEKENVETQLTFLKNQISPHFFMNTLNNIHSLIDIDAVEAKKSVIRLSNLMRHLLYESDNEMSPVKSEVDFIRSYVELMRLRYSDEVKITLKVPEKLPDKSIPPLLFISLLDNAFKHGISYVSKSFVEIELTFASDKLSFRIINSKVKETANNRSVAGIGIVNTRKRLDLLYNESYTLDLTDSGNIFITNLTIPI